MLVIPKSLRLPFTHINYRPFTQQPQMDTLTKYSSINVPTMGSIGKMTGWM